MTQEAKGQSLITQDVTQELETAKDSVDENLIRQVLVDEPQFESRPLDPIQTSDGVTCPNGAMKDSVQLGTPDEVNDLKASEVDAGNEAQLSQVSDTLVARKLFADFDQNFPTGGANSDSL